MTSWFLVGAISIGCWAIAAVIGWLGIHQLDNTHGALLLGTAIAVAIFPIGFWQREDHYGGI